MQGIIILCLLATLTNAQYNYNANSGSGRFSTGFISSGAGIAAPFIQQQAPQPQVQQYEEVNKEFYTYTAPEEDFAQPQAEQQGSSVSKKNLQVIFIHAPEQAGLSRAVQNLAQQTLQQQTAIYVLTRQPDLSQLSNSIQRESNHVSHRPEVHFVKYRTPEDAARAQQSIRAQYDALGGSSSHSDGGVAPVLNFASQQSSRGHSAGAGSGSAGHAQAPSQSYLPSNF